MVGKVVGVVVESELVSNVVLADGLEVRNILAGDHIPVQTRADVVFALEVGDTFGYFSDGFVDLGGPFQRDQFLLDSQKSSRLTFFGTQLHAETLFFVFARGVQEVPLDGGVFLYSDFFSTGLHVFTLRFFVQTNLFFGGTPLLVVSMLEDDQVVDIIAESNFVRAPVADRGGFTLFKLVLGCKELVAGLVQKGVDFVNPFTRAQGFVGEFDKVDQFGMDGGLSVFKFEQPFF